MSLRYVGKYEVIATLGRGSMGVVYKAKDPEIGRVVAIKTLRSVFMGDDSAGQEALKRFRQESRSAGKLRHPNIVTIFEAGRTESGSPYIAMEHIDGEPLEEAIANRCPMHPKEALHYLAQVASAIDYAHSQTVIHRDIKPSNVIVDKYYRPHLLDFGVAKLSDTSLTPAGTVVGTPSYMSPEQIRGETLDGATDVFAFAVVAFELFTGTRPFPGSDFTTVVNNIIHKGPLTFAEIGAELPTGLEAVLHKALSKDKTERYKSAMYFVEALADVFDLSVDEMGLVGGFRPEMREDEMDAFGVTAKITPPSMPIVPEDAEEPAANGADTSDSWQLGSAEEEAAKRKSSALPKILIVLILLAIAAAVAYFGMTFEGFKNENGAPQEDEPEAVEEFSEPAVAPDDEVAEESAPESEVKLETQPEPEPKPEPVKTATENQRPVRDPRLSFLSFEPEPVSAPAGGYTKDFIEALPDAKLASLFVEDSLSEEAMLYVVDAASKRRGIDFTRLLAFISAHENFRIRIQALKALAKSPHVSRPDAVSAVIGRLGDSDFLVRGFAAKILGDIPSRSSLNALEARRELEQNKKVIAILDRSIEAVAREVPPEPVEQGAESAGDEAHF